MQIINQLYSYLANYIDYISIYLIRIIIVVINPLNSSTLDAWMIDSDSVALYSVKIVAIVYMSYKLSYIVIHRAIYLRTSYTYTSELLI